MARTYTTCRVCNAMNMSQRKCCFQCGEYIGPDEKDISVVSGNLRKTERQDSHYAARLLDPRMGTFYQGAVENFDEGGILFCSNEMMVDRLAVRIEIEIDGRWYSAGGKVVYCNRRIGGVLAYASGVQFTDISASLREFLQTSAHSDPNAVPA